MDEIVRWGVLGTAHIAGKAVVPAILRAGNSRLEAVASRERGRAEDFARGLDVPKIYGDYRELLQDPDIQAVYIPLPNSLHREWAIRAAEAGKHVLCEKPLGLNAGECLEMKKAADDNGVYLMEAFMYRFHPRTRRIKTMVDEGVVGKLSFIDASFTFHLTNPDNIRFSADLGGGALMDVGCYCINVLRTMAGEEPVAVSAFSHGTGSGVDGRMAGVISFSSGLLGHFDCSLMDERRERYLLAGEKGFLEADNAFLPGTGHCTIREVRGGGEETVHQVEGVDEYTLMVEHFADSIIRRTPPMYGAEEAAANMRVIEALKDSAARGGSRVDIT